MRKKALRISVAAALIASMMSVPAYAESAVVTGNGVNMRSGPGTNYRVIDSLPRGATVNVSDRSNGSWYAVDYNGSSGFMSSSYLSITEEDYSGVTTPSGEGNAYINAMYVRFRSGPELTVDNAGRPSVAAADDTELLALVVLSEDGVGRAGAAAETHIHRVDIAV